MALGTVGSTPSGGTCGISIFDVLSKLVGGLEHFSFSHILGIIIPIDSYFSERLKPPTREDLTSYGWCLESQAVPYKASEPGPNPLQ